MRASCGPKIPQDGAIDAVLVGDPLARSDPLCPKQLADQLGSGSLVPLCLHQHVEHLTLCIDGSPEVQRSAADPDEHLVQVPSSMRRGAPRPQPTRYGWSEGADPAPDRLV